MGHRDPLHNLISKIDGDFYYREIPYFWAKKELVESNYSYRDFKEAETLDISKVAELKWKIFDTVYRDQLGMFQFFRPYYKKIYDEQFFEKQII